MVQKSQGAPNDEQSAHHIRAHILIIEARFYEDISDLLGEGAVAECERHGMTYERIVVPGALEIPQVLGAAAAARAAGRTTFDGAVALGCVIRGETGHYDIVCDNANHWLMDIAVRNEVPVGNAILTVDTREQAIARAEGGIKGKGGDAVRACARLIETKRAFWGASA
ncbi:6,7-dimethyl-8-ribityllumazine synthase [Hyphomicrobium denitrificans 1NES1]|uniref:6,7-dimethyl-8-ribityllumazine synthase n=1 Tax=Hyphomicrobium denitrificans 1NES1 TaxID=670307 RepID=N0B423_9HYPH|nr:6,7-dimethyl-8-ribityllumazine synthase [Hyphomicrobium denitrificans]AGK58269.1 6,7-dimethyl-8-ribityllumazine synthase [Hyphomicrobium denitrificans 1NES1]